MKKILGTICAALLTLTLNAQQMSIHDYSFIDIEGNEVSMESFKGKKILIVNVASKCGFTPQYEGLQELHETYKDKLVIIGFPCNQFGKQEPGTEEEIQSFCQKNYGVDFLMASKINVKGDDQHPIYKWLTSKDLNGVEDSKVQWNFQKYMIDEDGKYLKLIPVKTKPMDDEVTSLLK